MSRTARIVTGSVLAGVLLLVAMGTGILAAAGGSSGRGLADAFFDEDLSGLAEAEVLDVDDDYGWATVDVRFETEDGEVVVTAVDWEFGPLPDVEDVVGVAYDPADPEWAYAADDPYVRDVTGGAGGSVDDEAGAAEELAAGDQQLATVAGWVSLGALLALVVVAVVTVVAAVRAPAAAARPSGPYPPGPYPPGPYPPGPLLGGRQDPYVTAPATFSPPGPTDRPPTAPSPGRQEWSSPS